MKFKNYRNNHTKDNRIYSNREIADMSVREVFKNKDAIMSQHSQIGIPSEKELQASDNVVYVQSYTREDGTEVKAHYRSKPEGSSENNTNDNSQESITQEEQGAVTGAASGVISAKKDEGLSLKSSSEVSKFQDGLISFNNQQNANCKDARELMNISVIGPENIENTTSLKVLDNKETKERLLNFGINPTEDLKTVEFSSESSIAKSINNSSEIKKQIMDNISEVEQGKPLQIEFKSDTNLFRSLHNATIVGGQIKDNVLTGYIYDKYDFEYHILEQKEGFNWQSLTKINVANDIAAFLQEKDVLKNYYILIPIKIRLK